MTTPASGSGSAGPPRVHLRAALVALLLAASGLVGLLGGGQWLARHRLDSVATRIMVIKNRGLLLQETALARPDLLPIYAGSELVRVRANRATEFFAGAPTGFAVFPVADLGIPPLIQAENLAALAPHLRGRKLVLLISSPGYVRKEGPQRRAGYDGNFSRLHATAALTSLRLTPEIRRDFARRMRDYPGSLENDPLLDATTATLADTTVAGTWGYALLWPLNQARLLLLRASDAARVINELRGHLPPRPAPQPAPQWDELLAHAESTYRAGSTSNPFSFDDAWWTRYGGMLSRLKGQGSDSGFAAHMANSPWWQDLELGLATLHAEGARPLVLNIPLPGTFLTFAGVSPATRAGYYDRLRRLSERYGFPVVDLRDHDQDRLFLSDQDGHPSPAGWVHLDRMINAFYHDSLR